MCGIAGFYNTTLDPSKVDAVLDSLRRRGPDEKATYLNKDVGLIHTRLSIIELSHLGSQPYKYESLVLIHNGELYNYREVRSSLMKEGYSFQSNSDTEVLIKAFHCWREKCVERFIGMFAFGIYDESTDEIFLCRDRAGVKPLYYSFQEGVLRFASELRALNLMNQHKDIDPDAVSLYFRFGFIPGHHSIFKSVSKLEPGHYLKVNATGISKVRYWTPNMEVIEGKKEDEWLEELESLMISAFNYRLVSDVPVGVFLSGGIDSSLLTALLQRHNGGIHTFTIGFEERGFDESPFARKVAQHLQTDHTEKMLKLDEARDLLGDFYSVYDEPFADTSGIPMACIARLAKDQGMKVVLSADGGDELFGGYTHYQSAMKLFGRFMALPVAVRRAISASTRLMIPGGLRDKILPLNFEHKTYAFEELLNSDNPVAFFEAFIANQSMEEVGRMVKSGGAMSIGQPDARQNPLESMMDWDLRYYLPDDLLVKVDRATMHHSIECREPFLDHRLIEFALRIPTDLKVKGNEGKYLLRKLLSRHVPAELFNRRKQGFSIPVFEWFSKELDDLFGIYLSKSRIKDVPFLDADEVEKEYKKYLYYKGRGKQYNVEKMWRILSFMMWWEKFMTR
jgi:asparagine synthase (glutamine-hydrolysing)